MIVTDASHPTVMILANGGKHVGWGHIMRCCSIGSAAAQLGAHVVFAVMNQETASLVSSLGFDYRLVRLRSSALAKNGEYVVEIAHEIDAHSVLVDSYDVSRPFFRELSRYSFEVAYIDDVYFEDKGRLKVPEELDIDLIVNYGFAFKDADYSSAYKGTRTRYLVGPLYAPVRAGFCDLQYEVSPIVTRILLTSGSTNPDFALERMLVACNAIDPNIVIDVVVGRNAEFDFPIDDSERIVIHRGIRDLSRLMVHSDIVVSSAGSTLYELACIGVPTIALPVVENQIDNARGFDELELGAAALDVMWDSEQVFKVLTELIDDFAKRYDYSREMRKVVDGKGASRIAKALLPST